MRERRPAQIVLVQRVDIAHPLAARGRRGQEGGGTGVDGEDCSVDTAQLALVGMNVHHGRASVGQGVGLARDLGEAGADEDEQVRLVQRFTQPGVQADPDVARIMAVGVVEQLLATESAGHGNAGGLGEGP